MHLFGRTVGLFGNGLGLLGQRLQDGLDLLLEAFQHGLHLSLRAGSHGLELLLDAGSSSPHLVLDLSDQRLKLGLDVLSLACQVLAADELSQLLSHLVLHLLKVLSEPLKVSGVLCEAALCQGKHDNGYDEGEFHGW